MEDVSEQQSEAQEMMKIFITVVFLVVAGCVSSATLQPKCDTRVSELARHSGFYRLPNSRAARMFYLFFNSRARKTDPVVLWLAGGPGCGGETSALQGNGPFLLSNMSLLLNPNSWDMVANLLYVDQPIGTGFSLSPDANDIRYDEEAIAGDLYDFLQAFFKDRPRYAKNRFYIAGESYAGHLNPALASRIQRGNTEQKGIHINLKGVAIGNGWTNPIVQYVSSLDYALYMKLIRQAEYRSIHNALVPKCEYSLRKCVSIGEDCDVTDSYCQGIWKNISKISGVDVYNIRRRVNRDGLKPLAELKKFLDQKCLQDALGVGQVDYIACSPTTVRQALTRDFEKNLDTGIPSLLEDGVEVLIYVGVYDLICNWIGIERWVKALKWSGARQFKASPARPFLVNGVKAGEVKSHGPLGFVKVYRAGHSVILNQPKTALEMVERWIGGGITNPT